MTTLLNMLSRFKKISLSAPVFGPGLFTTIPNRDDIPHVDKYKIFSTENETGWDRIKNIFRMTEEGLYNPRVTVVSQTALISFLLGGLIGGISNSRTAFINFIENNEATRFLSHLDAKRQLSDKMILSMTSGFFRLGTRVSFFCTSFMAAYTVLATYYDKDTVLFYPIGGMYAGAMYKFSLGPKGMVSGAIVGSFFGSIYAGLKLLLLKAIDLSEQEFTEGKHQLKEDRDKAIVKGIKSMQLEEDEKEMLILMNDGKK